MVGSFTAEYFLKGKWRGPLLLNVFWKGNLCYFLQIHERSLKFPNYTIVLLWPLPWKSDSSIKVFLSVFPYKMVSCLRKNIYDIGNSWKISIFKCAFEKIAHISLSKGMYSCHHDIIPEVMFAVNASIDENHYFIIYWSIKTHTDNLRMGGWVGLYVLC